ncbi:class I SAM-dependent RNA methyltransferase [Pseudaestuariivita rosea]|uniref:class I SAM-dependent RNA methyltransferase n=1 Tax=Pseudaestuariivita rosea TaxID=2763263 RepID=UPI001ABAFC59|nr:class I SAM-dependent RNA methyltransferase [Pseudaestuariivita rosea]
MTWTIQRLGHQGDGIADGPVFAARTLPGEQIDGTLNDDRIDDIKIIKPSSDRVKPLCSHYKICGGCSLQHASDAFVATWKKNIVTTALQAHGIHTDVATIHSSPPNSRRRAKLAGRRTKSGAIVGFHGKSTNIITSVTDCRVLSNRILATFPDLEAMTMMAASRKAPVSLIVTENLNAIDLAIDDAKPITDALRAQLGATASQRPFNRLTWNGEILYQLSQPFQSFGRAQVTPPPGAFLQATPDGQTTLINHVMRAVQDARKVIDLFAGCGTFALPLASFTSVHAVEADAEMLLALHQGWRTADGLRKVTTEDRDLFRRPVLPDELAPYDAAVIDPPRAGAEAQVTELIKSKIGKICYVSCNPVTFARDAAMLVAGGYNLGDLHVVDQFRWSTHIELVAVFSNRS